MGGGNEPDALVEDDESPRIGSPVVDKREGRTIDKSEQPRIIG